MKIMSSNQIHSIINPRKLFLIDSLGALLSAVMLGFILPRFEEMFGAPPNVLWCLSFIACVFSIYSFACFLYKKGNWRPYMKLLGIINLMYCVITIGLIIYLYPKLTTLGLMYFVVEIIVIAGLAGLELRTASNKSENRNVQ
jgi:phosphatidylglycerophosphate synthase